MRQQAVRFVLVLVVVLALESLAGWSAGSFAPLLYQGVRKLAKNREEPPPRTRTTTSTRTKGRPLPFRFHRSPVERDSIPGLSGGGLKLKALKGLFCEMVQLIIARTSP